VITPNISTCILDAMMDLNSMNNYKMKITMLSRLIEELEEDFETKLKKI